MPPNNFFVPTDAEDANDVTKTESHEHETHERHLISRKSKNFLNATTDSTETAPKTDLNGNSVESESDQHELHLVWRNIIAFVFLHYWFINGFAFLGFNWLTLFHVIYGVFTGFGITAGAHRLWAHGAYKANLALKIFLAYFQTAAFQNTIFEWTRDHRSHHKFTDTNADPHSASRGFFFAHMGWLLCKKHPDVKKQGEKIDMSDLERDPVVIFQRNYFFILMPLCHTVIPVGISMMAFGAHFNEAFFLNVFRYVTVLHFTWLVNSYAHFFGSKPFDEHIKPTDSYTVAMLAFGEGWHNYHHVFPYDYKTSEHGKYWCNFTTGFIDFMSQIGWATDLKTISPKIIIKRARRTGDGSFIISHLDVTEILNDEGNDGTFDEHIWGWQDELITADEKRDVTIINNTENLL